MAKNKKQFFQLYSPYMFFALLCLVVTGIFLWRLLPQTHVLGANVTSNIGSIDTTVSVKSSQTITSLPSRYLGFSFETESLCNLVGSWDTSTFERLMKNLGPQVIRIGGNTADHALWNPTGQYECSNTKTVLTRQLIDSFFSLAFRINTKIVWTLNLGNYAPSTYADEAKYVINKGIAIGATTGNFLWGLAIGNEPDLYHTNGLRSSSYSVYDYINQWNAYKTTIRNVSGHSTEKFTGPDIADNDTWFTTFLADEIPVLARSSHHFYAIHKNRLPAGETKQQVIETLLSKSLMQSTATTIAGWKNDSRQVPLVINESNSVNSGGYPGVSNSFASTLWGLDYFFTALERGAKQLNLHGGGGSDYSPINFYSNDTLAVRPLYYAMLAFRYTMPSGYVVATSISTPYNIVSHSALVNNSLRVALINKDLTHNANVQVNADRQYRSAGVIYLSAPSIDATSGVTFGGQTVASDGSWSGKGQTIPLSNNGYSVQLMLPSASAAIVIFTN